MGERTWIECHLDGAWRRAAEVRLRGGPNRTHPTTLAYDLDHSLAHVGERGLAAVSVRYPVDFDLHDGPTFPAFCIDLIPQGPARRHIEGQLRREGLAPSDWAVLMRGAGSPVGNLRVADAARPPVDAPRGVPREEVVSRGETFAAWAEDVGIPMQGASDTTGASPKLLLVEDDQGLLHADGALPDEAARRHWLVKFPRGRTVRDDQVLASEAPYLEVARRLGLRCGAPLHHDGGALFVPRFDRVVEGGRVTRLGVESLYSVMGVVEPGAWLVWEQVCAAVAAVVDDPEACVVELVLRDALRLALGDPDNHGRNSALWKTPAGVSLSPLYDFAPMFLDPEGIVRTTRWACERAGRLDWRAVVASLEPLVPPEALVSRLLALRTGLGDALAWLGEFGVDREVLELLRPGVAQVRDGLGRLEG